MKVIEDGNKSEPIHLPFDAAMAGLATGAYASAEAGDIENGMAPDHSAAAEPATDAKASSKKTGG